MADTNSQALSRRTVLQTATGVLLGGGLIATSTGATDAAPYHVLQGETCLPLRPLSGSRPVEEFYNYQLPDDQWASRSGTTDDGGPYYSSAGTQPLQRHDTSVLFLYDGPSGLSLVVIHGKTGSSPHGGGSATFTITGLPTTGRWVVTDDLYLDPETGDPAPSNYDRWHRDGTTHTIAWTWGSTGTDGGAFRDLGNDVTLTIDPAFNEDARRLDYNYDGTVTAWQVLSGARANPERYTVAMDEPLTITTSECPADAQTGGGEQDTTADTGHASDGDQSATDDASHTQSEADTDGPPYYVCHKPPGNPSNAHTIKVGSKQAVDAHLRHGDSKGPCGTGGQDSD